MSQDQLPPEMRDDHPTWGVMNLIVRAIGCLTLAQRRAEVRTDMRLDDAVKACQRAFAAEEARVGLPPHRRPPKPPAA